MNRTRTWIAVLVLIVILGAGAYALSTSLRTGPTPTPVSPLARASDTPTLHASPTPTLEPTALRPPPVIGYTPVPSDTISPVVVQRSPELGQEAAPDGGIQLVFDRAMNQPAVESAFAIQSAGDQGKVAGKLTWADPRTLTFTPSKPLERGAVYDVALNQSARAADGAPLRSAYQFRFATAGFLQVGQVMPAPDTADVEADARITVIFNRPVVPLTSLDQQANFPQPLTLDPPVKGRGQWLNTSIYIFEPDERLAGGTTYTARVGGVQDADGNPMSADYIWRFTTQPPKVVWVSPGDKAQKVPIEAAVRVQFNQPVDAASAQQAFSLRAGGKAVPGAFEIFSDTLVFTPTARLPFDAPVQARVAAGVKAAAGGLGGREDFAWTFSTVPLPRIVRTDPADGARDASPYTSFTIFFNTHIDPATVMPNIQMNPPLSPTLVYTSYWDEGFSLSFGAQPSTDYVVKIGPDIADVYGNRTGQALTVRFRTSDLGADLRLRVSDFIGTYSAYAPARLYVSYVNVNRVDLALYRLAPNDLLQLSRDWYHYDPPASALVRQWSQSLEALRNKVGYAPIDAAQDKGPLAPGVYLLVAGAPGIGQDNYGLRHLMVVSKFNLTLKAFPGGALVWATDLQSGQPAPGLNVAVYDYDAHQAGSATTDSDGVAVFSFEQPDRNLMLALAAEPFAAVSTDWSRGVSPWDFGLQASYDLPGYRAHIYTDRPIYRPGQAVHFKGILRAETDVSYTLPTGQSRVHVIVVSPSGEQLLDKDLALDDYGAFDGEIELAEGAALGTYSIQATLAERSFQANFQVAAYRPPEFEVTVEPDAAQVVRPVNTSATVQVKYFFGGAVAGVPVEWNVLADDYAFQPAWGGNYSFRDTDDPWSCFDCWWFHPENPRRVVLSGNGVTDDQGRLKIEISDLKFQMPLTGSLQLIVEATATGSDNQVVSGRGQIVAHRGDYYIGLAADKYVGQEGQPFGVNLAAVDWRGDNPRLPGKPLTIQVYRREWKNTFIQDKTGGGHWSTETDDVLVDAQSVTTNERGEAAISFVPPQGGSFRVVAADRDAPLAVRSSLFVWVTGKEYVSWWRENNDRINLIADKVTYSPGETAEILIPSPYQGPHVALVTVERGGVLKHEVIQMTSNSQVYRLPLSADYAPNVYVSVVLVKGAGLPSPDGAQAEGVADYKVGIAPLEVKPVAQTLNVTLAPNPSQGEPGKDVVYTLRATDVAGQPVQAELSLDLVDKAVLTLLPRPKNAIVEEFYGKRGLGVQTSSGLAVSANRLLLQVEQDLGVRQAALMVAGTPAAMPTATAAQAAPAPEAKMAWADNAQVPAGVQIRQEFADTAYWNASVVTDREGKATVTVKLPDNLTTWVMRGVGVGRQEGGGPLQVGEGTVDLVSTKPLLVRPVTPRFFVVGDKAQLAAIVNNNTDSPLQATVALSATGVTLSTPAVQTTTIAARGESKLTWEVSVQDLPPAGGGERGGAELVFWAVASEFSDASKPRLATGPDGSLLVYRYSAPDIVGAAGDLASAGARTEVIALPPKYDDRQGELSVQLDPSLAAAMQDGLNYLEHYEYECTEQTVSRFLPNVLTFRALKELGLSDPDLEKRLPGLVEQGLGKLYNQQRQDGGWGWWPDSLTATGSQTSNVQLTAYVVFALIKAQQSGFEVRGDALQRGQQFLSGALVPARDLNSTGSANRQSFVLYVLAEGKQAQKDRLADLVENRDKLSHYGRAFLALALWLGDPSDARIATLLSDLNNAAILSATGAHWEESYSDWWAMNTDTRSTAIILDALARISPPPQSGGGGLAPNVVRWLMVARKGGYWETTQETAWALIALTDWMKATGELQGNYDYAVFLNDKDEASGQVSQSNVRESVKLSVAVAELLKESNRLTISRGDGSGRLYYTAHLRVFLPVQDIKPVSRGITVNRRYTLASCTDGPKCPEVKEVKLGDVIRVDLTLVAPNDLYYVVVEDPLPAGGEAVDTGLATTSLLEQGPDLVRQGNRSYYWWWWHWYSRSELRDEKVVLFADYLARGTYEYSYTFRATLPGDYQVIPTVAREFYFPEVFGRSDGRLLSIGR